MSLRRALVGVLGVALLASSAGAALQDAASDTDLSWVGRLPGFSVRDRSASETNYIVSGDAKEAFAALQKALAERGWRIEPGKSNTLSVLSAQRMTATKGRVEAFFYMKQAAIIVKLTVTTRTVEPAAAALPPKPAPPAPEAREPAAKPAAGDAIELFENALRGTYRCEGSRVTVNANACDITLQGACESLSVTGNGNRVRVVARIDAISVLGNQNTVTWSSAANPKAPRVSNLGTGSSVRAE